MLLRAQMAAPRKYSEDSRDFQLLEHLYDAAFNNSKTAIDAFDPVVRTSIDSKLLNLACRTVGFDNKGDYDASVLMQVVKTFKYFLRNKGKRQTIEEAVQLLLNSQHITKDYLLLIANYEVQLYLPTNTQNVQLLREILDYILPMGYLLTIRLQDVNTVDYYDYLSVRDVAEHRFATDEELASLDYINKLNDLGKLDSEGKPLSDEHMNATPSVNIETVLTGQKE